MTEIITPYELKFLQYDRENPHVYELFKKLAFQMKNTGRKKYGAAAIFEAVRWHHDIETVGDEFKINNNYKPMYARKLMDEHPEFRDFFRTRQSPNLAV